MGAQGGEDWSAAEYLLAGASEVLYRPACFHAQQSAEKYLKAVLIVRGIGFPRTHNLEQLLVLLEAAGARLDGIDADQLGTLTPHAVTSRYPDDFEVVDVGQAREVLDIARSLRAVVRQVLPGAVLV